MNEKVTGKLLPIVLLLALVACGGGGAPGGPPVSEDHGVVVSPASAELEVGESELFSAVVNDGTGDQAVDWSSSDELVATVDAAGLVTGVAAGDTTITAVSTADSSLYGTAAAVVERVRCQAPVEIDSDVIADRTLERLGHSLDCADYLVTDYLQVRAALVVEAGVTVEFAAAAGLFVSSPAGSLNAAGTVAQPIVFRGTAAAAGHWRGLIFGTSSAENLLEHVLIRDTGFVVRDAIFPLNLQAAVIVPNTHQVSISHTQFGVGSGGGVYLGESAALVGFSDNSFQDLTQAPLALDLAQLQYIGSGNQFRGLSGQENGHEVISIIRDYPLTALSITMADLGVPYHVTVNQSLVGTGLEVEAGVHVEFATDVVLSFDDSSGPGLGLPGLLTLAGTAEDPVLFTADIAPATSEYWGGIYLAGSSSAVIDHAEIGYGGAYKAGTVPPIEGANIVLAGAATLEINNSLLHDAPLCYQLVAGASGSVSATNLDSENCKVPPTAGG